MLFAIKVASATDGYRIKRGRGELKARMWVTKEEDGHNIPRPPIRLARSTMFKYVFFGYTYVRMGY